MFNNASVLITGGTGSFGYAFTEFLLNNYFPERVIIFSRDEYKQFVMKNKFMDHPKSSCLRFFIGDVRDKDRVKRAFEDVDYVVHAAALKQVQACEYNPLEAVNTNIDGAENIINAALDSPRVKKVVALSTDKAVNPVNLYGATKMVSDKLFIAANSYVGKKEKSFSIVRYGNVAGSRGSVIPFFDKLIKSGAKELPITHRDMTRFWISLEEGVKLVVKALEESIGGETFISKIPSFKITDLAKAMLPDCEIKDVGIREGEKMHEIMVTVEDSMHTYEYSDHYIVYPQIKFWGTNEILPGGEKLEYGFSYSSDSNTDWLSVEELTQLVDDIYYSKE